MYELCFPSSPSILRLMLELSFHSINGLQRKCPSGFPTGITCSSFFSFPPFFSVKGIFPMSQQVVERLQTQTPNCLMNPKDPQGMLKALQGRHGTQVSSLPRLRALFQLFLMYSGAQTARLTWPKWNHSILSNLPMEPQQQILPAKSRLWVFQAFWDHWSIYVLYCNISFVSLSLVCGQLRWCHVKQLTMQQEHSCLLSSVRGIASASGNEQCCSHCVHDAASHTHWSACCYNLDYEISRECGCMVD